MAQEGNNRMYAIAEHLQNPISTRYDDIYHPRTDKRVISKLIFIFLFFECKNWFILFFSFFLLTTVIIFLILYRG
jgi:hypothetical protein